MELDDFRGVYSTRQTDHTASVPGTGQRKKYWLVWDGEGGTALVQPLSSKLEPAGAKQIISREELLARFTHEPVAVPAFSSEASEEPESWNRFSAAVVDAPASVSAEDADSSDGTRLDKFSPATESAAGAEERGGRPVLRQTVDLDELTLEETLGEEDVAERAAKTEFATALSLLKEGNSRKAVRALKELAAKDAPYEERHKHMFTDFGIVLRKSRLFDVAVEYHKRALALSPDDDHICHNIARCYYENGDAGRAMTYLKKSLDMNPALTESIRFIAYIRRTQKGATPVAEL